MKRKVSSKEEPAKDCEDCEEEELSQISSLLLNAPQMNHRDVLAENGVIFLNGQIDDRSVLNVIKKLWWYHFDSEFDGEINLIINSVGGYVSSGWALIDTISAIRHKVNAVAMGSLMSMAVMVFIACEHRIIAEHTSSMVHHFSSSSEGKYPELIAERKGLDLEYKRYIRHLVEFSKYRTEKEVLQNILKKEDNWLSPKEMKKHGLADEIFECRKKK